MLGYVSTGWTHYYWTSLHLELQPQKLQIHNILSIWYAEYIKYDVYLQIFHTSDPWDPPYFFAILTSGAHVHPMFSGITSLQRFSVSETTIQLSANTSRKPAVQIMLIISPRLTGRTLTNFFISKLKCTQLTAVSSVLFVDVGSALLSSFLSPAGLASLSMFSGITDLALVICQNTGHVTFTQSLEGIAR